MNYHLTPPWSVEGGEERRGESHSYLYYTWWEWCQTMVFGKGGERQRRVNVFIDKTGSSRAEDWDRAEAESTLPGPTRAESPADVFDLITSVCPWFGRIERHSHQTVRFINILFCLPSLIFVMWTIIWFKYMYKMIPKHCCEQSDTWWNAALSRL